MKNFVPGAALLLLLSAGCAADKPMADESDDEGSVNVLMVRTQFDQNQRGGILAQRTIYPYHFTPDSAALTELGEQQVEILASGYHGQAHVNVVRGADAQALHDARVETIRNKLIAAGIAPAALTIGEGPPGGLGLSSKAAIEALEPPDSKAMAAPEKTRSGSSNGSTRSTGESGVNRGTSADSYNGGFGGKSP